VDPRCKSTVVARVGKTTGLRAATGPAILPPDEIVTQDWPLDQAQDQLTNSEVGKGPSLRN
jgi:hypothetical protein